MAWTEARRYFHRTQDEAAMRDIAQRRERGYPGADVRRGEHTIGDLMNAIMHIDDDADAARFYRGMVEDIRARIEDGTWRGTTDAEAAAGANIGWCFGEGLVSERVAMWRRVCDAEHPGFGTTIPTPERAVEAGKRTALGEY